MTTIPTAIRMPLTYFENDPSNALDAPSLLRYTGLLMGQKTTAGTVAELTKFSASNADEVSLKAGAGSQAHRMAIQWFKNNPGYSNLDVITIDDAGASTAGTFTITLVGSTILAGTLSLKVNGVLMDITVLDAATITEIGDDIVTAITAKTELPVTAVNVAGTVTLTAKNKGTAGNKIDTRINDDAGQVTPGGLTVTIAAVVTGATDPDVDEILAVLNKIWYQVWIMPWNDTTNRGKIEDELAIRFGPTKMADGVLFISKRGTPAELVTYGNAGNSPHTICLHSTGVPESPEEVAAAVAGLGAFKFQQDPARALQFDELLGISPPSDADQFEWADNNNLLYNGISTFEVQSDGSVNIARLITMYQKNDSDIADVAYLNATTMFSLLYIRYDSRVLVKTKFPNAKLADDGQDLPSNQSIATPNSIKGAFVNRYKQWVEVLGITENLDDFKSSLDVVRNVSDRDRVDLVMSTDLMNQLRVLGITNLFRL